MSTLELIVEELKTLPPAKLDQAAEYIHQLQEANRTNALKNGDRCIPEAAFTEAVEHVMTHHAPLMKKLAS